MKYSRDTPLRDLPRDLQRQLRAAAANAANPLELRADVPDALGEEEQRRLDDLRELIHALDTELRRPVRSTPRAAGDHWDMIAALRGAGRPFAGARVPDPELVEDLAHDGADVHEPAVVLVPGLDLPHDVSVQEVA